MAFQTGDIAIPDQVFDPWVSSIHNGSAVAVLSPAIPMNFGPGEGFTITGGEAEYVGESAQKSETPDTFNPYAVGQFKFQKTVRFSSEVKWADEDRQLGVINEVLNQVQPSLSRALDFGVIHGINPLSGAAVPAMKGGIAASEAAVEMGDTPVYDAVDEADQLVLEAGNLPSGLAADTALLARYGRLRDKDGRRLYDNISYSTNAGGVLDGHNYTASRTVSARGVAAEDTNLIGVVGDFSSVRWGIQRAVGIELIEFGDPDGSGDLKRKNEVAIRAEIVYGWGITDLDAFALVKSGAGTGE